MRNLNLFPNSSKYILKSIIIISSYNFDQIYVLFFGGIWGKELSCEVFEATAKELIKYKINIFSSVTHELLGPKKNV